MVNGIEKIESSKDTPEPVGFVCTQAFIKRKRDKVKLDNTEVGKGDIRVEKIADVFSSPSILKSRKDN